MITFGEFEADEQSGRLSRNGERIKVQDLPFRMLVALLQRPGEVVTREELRAALWGAGTFVDAEAGLNTAAAKLREALGDSAEQPKFIETIPKRGYRFVGTINSPASFVQSPGSAAAKPGFSRPGLIIAALGVVLFVGILVYSFTRYEPVTIAVVRFHNETGNPEFDRLANDLTDAVVVSLASTGDYAVIGNSPVLRTDRIFEDVGRIGAALDAPFVVLGQLQMSDAGLVGRAHFIRTSDAKHLWAEKIDLADSNAREERVTALVTSGVARGLERSRSGQSAGDKGRK